MAGRILVPGWARALDSDGDPISAAISLFNTGTSDLAPVYSDEALTIPLANPVLSNSAGRFPAIWAADDAEYDWSVVAPYGPPASPFTGTGLTTAEAADVLAAEAAEAAADFAEAAALQTAEDLAAIQALAEEYPDGVAGLLGKADTDGGNISGPNPALFRTAIGAVGSAALADTAQGSNLVASPFSGVTVGSALKAFPDEYFLAPFSFTGLNADGDSFFLQPNVHTAGDSLAYKYGVNLGLTGGAISINAVSGQTSADGQAALFARSILSSHHNLIGFGQNDAQYIGAVVDARKYVDIAKQMLASQLWLGIPDGTNSKVRANGLGVTESGVWADDPDIAGARRTTANGAVLAKTFTNCRWVVVWKKVENGSGGFGHIDTNGTSKPTVRFAPAYTSVLTNATTDFAVQAEYYDLGRVVESVVVQVIVDSTTGAGNPVTVVGFGGLSGDPLAGPLLGVCDLSDRGPAGYATAGSGGAQQSVSVISKINLLAAAVCARMGVRTVDFPLSKYLPVSSALAADEFHPSEAGATSAAALMAARVVNGSTIVGARPDLMEQAYALGSTADGLGQDLPLSVGPDGSLAMRKLGGNSLSFPVGNTVVPASGGIRLASVDSTGTALPNNSLFLIHDGSSAFIQSIAGSLTIGGEGANQLAVSATALSPTTNDAISLGKPGLAYTYINMSFGLLFNMTKVVGAQGAAVADAAAAAAAPTQAEFNALVTQFNALLARVRAHGLIAT